MCVCVRDSQELQQVEVCEGSLWDGAEGHVHHRPVGKNKNNFLKLKLLLKQQRRQSSTSFPLFVFRAVKGRRSSNDN